MVKILRRYWLAVLAVYQLVSERCQEMMVVKKIIRSLFYESGIGLVELLVAMVMMTIVMSAVLSVLVSAMKTQTKIGAELRAEMNAKQALYDIEKNMAGAKRYDNSNPPNAPVFQNDTASFPAENGTWITYTYATPPGGSGPTIIRRISTSEPAFPLTISSSDKQLIGLNGGQETAAVSTVGTAPIFTYWDANGDQILPDPTTGSVADPRSVRSIKIAFQTTVSEPSAQRKPYQVSAEIDLRNYDSNPG